MAADQALLPPFAFDTRDPFESEMRAIFKELEDLPEHVAEAVLARKQQFAANPLSWGLKPDELRAVIVEEVRAALGRKPSIAQ